MERESLEINKKWGALVSITDSSRKFTFTVTSKKKNFHFCKAFLEGDQEVDSEEVILICELENFPY